MALTASSGETVHGAILSAVRDWKGWLAPLPLPWENCFMSRANVPAPHSWSFKRRPDLWHADWSAGVEDQARWEPHNQDVMLCLKEYMRDQKLQQPPVQCLSSRHRLLLTEVLPAGLVERHALTKKQIDDYLTLAAFAERGGRPRAAQALVALTTQRPYERVPLDWMRYPRSYRRDHSLALGRNPFFSHLPSPTWRMVMTGGT